MKLKLFLPLFIFIIPILVFGQSFAPFTQEQLDSLNPTQKGLLENSLNLIKNSSFSPVDSNTGLPNGISEQISTEIKPSIPAPNEPFYIAIESFSTNLNAANIVWTVNGQTVLQGLGKKRLDLVSPGAGVRMDIVVSITKSGGGTIRHTFEFTPAEVDIVYEANTYTPPFYKGRALFTNEATLTFIAIPDFVKNGVNVPEDQLIYKWKIDNQVMGSDSGVGRNRFVYKGELIQRSFTVTVEVEDQNSSLIATKSIPVTEFSPLLLIYENNPLIGTVFEQAVLGDFMLTRNEVDFIAIPYFFSADFSDDTNLSYEWFINGAKINIPSNQNNITFRNTTNQKGTSLINLRLSHFNNIIQSSNSKLSLKFGEGLEDFSF